MMGGNTWWDMAEMIHVNCGYQNDSSTYEWLYVHSNDITQRSSLDLQFAEAIMNLVYQI